MGSGGARGKFCDAGMGGVGGTAGTKFGEGRLQGDTGSILAPSQNNRDCPKFQGFTPKFGIFPGVPSMGGDGHGGCQAKAPPGVPLPPAPCLSPVSGAATKGHRGKNNSGGGSCKGRDGGGTGLGCPQGGGSWRRKMGMTTLEVALGMSPRGGRGRGVTVTAVSRRDERGRARRGARGDLHRGQGVLRV